MWALIIIFLNSLLRMKVYLTFTIHSAIISIFQKLLITYESVSYMISTFDSVLIDFLKTHNYMKVYRI